MSNIIEGQTGLSPRYVGDDGWRPLASYQSCCASEFADEQEANAQANARLIALAPTAPHDCDIPGCPGAENKRRLDMHERMLRTLRHASEFLDCVTDCSMTNRCAACLVYEDCKAIFAETGQ